MKKLTLSEAQIREILSQLAGVHDEDGSFDIDIELDGITINAKGSIELDGYIEDDYHCGYMNGTGAWVETYRSASVEVRAFDEDGEVEIDIEIENEIYKYLNAA